MNRADLVSALRQDAGISSAEYSDTVLNDWADNALTQHNRSYAWATLPVHEGEAVKLLTWIQVCRARASKSAQYYAISGEEGSLNKAEIMRNNLEMLRTLQADYLTVCGRLGISGAPEIVVSDITVFDPVVHAQLPSTAAVDPEPVRLTVLETTSTTISLQWSLAQPTYGFCKYRVFYGTSSGLADPSSRGTDGITFVGLNNDKVTLLKDYTEIQRTSCKITGLTEGTDYYFVVQVMDENGNYSISNEVSTAEEAAPDTETVQYLTLNFATLAASTEYVTALTFGSAISVRSLAITLTTAPSGGSCVFRVYREADGAGAYFEASVLAEASSGSNTGEFDITVEQALYLRTDTVNGAAGATVIVGYVLS